jgi:hypothetical protein
VLCLVPAGYATLSGPLPAADTALMRTRIDSTLRESPGHLIRTQGGARSWDWESIRWGGFTIGPQSITPRFGKVRLIIVNVH